jgi:uncharacterized protein YgiM (DUF1202 family)
VRDDLADVELADRVFAPHYAKAAAVVVTKATTVHSKPSADTGVVATLMTGTVIDLFDLSAGWGWVRTANSVGYILADCVEPA